jgi:hypothetical protein
MNNSGIKVIFQLGAASLPLLINHADSKNTVSSSL